MQALIAPNSPYITILDLEGLLIDTLILRQLSSGISVQGKHLNISLLKAIEQYTQNTWETNTLHLSGTKTLSIRVYAAIRRLLQHKALSTNKIKEMNVWNWKKTRFSITLNGRDQLNKNVCHTKSIS